MRGFNGRKQWSCRVMQASGPQRRIVCLQSLFSTTRTRPVRRARGTGLITISTSRPSNVRKCISRSTEKFVRFPRCNRDTLG